MGDKPVRATRRFLTVLAFFLLSRGGPACAQDARLYGLVRDPSAAVIPNARIGAIHRATRIERNTYSNEEGFYALPALQPGYYAVVVEAQGFRTFVREDLILNAEENARLDLQLEVGARGESMTVTGDAGVVDNTDGSVGTTTDRTFVEHLPLNGRSIHTLVQLAPGVVLTRADSLNPGQFSANGQRANANSFTIDGVSANFGAPAYQFFGQAGSGSVPATNVQGSFANLVSIDALQEFRIQTSPIAPEFGRYPGAQISLVTRSGSNRVSGSLFEYFRNDKLDANDWFANAGGLAKAALRYNDYGGTVGGPVYLPRSYDGRNRTFFFLSYEGQRFVLPQPAVLRIVPSLAARRDAPAAVAPLLTAFPLPNGPELGDAGGAIFLASYSDPSDSDAYSIRVDHAIGQGVALFGRYNRSPSFSVSRTDNPAINDVRGSRTATLTLGSTQTVTPRLVNEARMNLSRQHLDDSFRFDGFGGAVRPADSLLFPPGYSSRDSLFIFTIFGLEDNSYYWWLIGSGSNNRQRQLHLVDNLTFTTGAHQWKFGVDHRWLRPFVESSKLTLSPTFEGIYGPGSVYGGVSPYVFVGGIQAYGLVFKTLSTFLQDTWMVTPRLTLVYGVRWELNPPPYGANGVRLATFRGLGDLNDFSRLSIAPPGTPLFPTVYRNFAPRAGLACQLVRKEGRELVARAGAGIFYDLGQTNFGDIGFPYTMELLYESQPFPLPASIAQLPPPDFTLSPANPVWATVPAPGYRVPRVYRWNLALEQSIGSLDVSASYLGALGRDLARSETVEFSADPNNPVLPYNPDFANLTVIGNTGGSDYHSLQIESNRRLSHGLRLMASYTWSHSIDNSSSDSTRMTLRTFASPGLDRGNSDFDVRHSVTGAVVYSLPASRRRPLNVLGRNWSVNGIFFARSAPPADVIADRYQPAFNSSFTRRPNLVLGVPLYLDDAHAPGGKVFNAAAFTFPAEGQFQGTLGRNVLRGFGAWQLDFSLHRQFRIAEATTLEFRAEFFNIFNHPNFANPDALSEYLDSPFFGRSTAMLGRGLGGLNPLFQSGGPRAIQLALRIQF